MKRTVCVCVSLTVFQLDMKYAFFVGEPLKRTGFKIYP